MAVLTALLVVAANAGVTAPPAFKLYIERDGAYCIDFDDLSAIGLDGPVPSWGLGLTAAGDSVPLWVEDGGDGIFGPGDWIEFVGKRLRGEYSFYSEYTRYNVYFLRTGQENPLRMESRVGGDLGGLTREPPSYRCRQHLEEDLLILRLPPAENGVPEELWYWAKLVHNQKQPFSVTLDLPDLEPAPGGTVDLEVRFRGWSKPSSKPDPETVDHQVQVLLNGDEIGGAEWNGTQPYRLEIPAIPADRFSPGKNVLNIVVSKRSGDAAGGSLIDVVMLNSIDIDYPRNRWVGDEPAHFALADQPRQASFTSTTVVLESDPNRELILYGEQGSRSFSSRAAGNLLGQRREHVFYAAPGESSFVAASPEQLLSPAAVVRDRPSQLTDSGNRADYIVIAHASLLAAVQPLAELHRSRGLDVVVADVEDVYDEFNHGVVHPRAIRDFLDHAYHHWRTAPKFVLLVGDASWDGKNENAADLNYADWTYRPGEISRFGKNTSTPYPEGAELNRRGLIPTWNHATYEGHSASDNYFVSIDGDDHLPDMAIGRFPVVGPEEVERIVAKTSRYVTEPEVGPWRRSALFITNENWRFQRQSDRLALALAAAGFASERVYPASSEVSNEHHTRRLIESFDRGQLVVHFLGHGGRYIWRTGPPDLKKNHDLFTLEHLQELAPTDRLPVVLSLTCYSAPFDHPSADSIGEKLLRIEDKGAIAVVAASWRNSPSPGWGKVLLEELTTRGTTVGEAVMRAKHRLENRMFVETYNLLGDPAVPMALPTAMIELRTNEDEIGSRPFRVQGSVGIEGFAGRVIIDLVGHAGEALRTIELETNSPDFQAEFEIARDDLAAASIVRAYAWNASRGFDAIGAVKLLRETRERVGARGRALRSNAPQAGDPRTGEAQNRQ